jgi:hypothetical protein
MSSVTLELELQLCFQAVSAAQLDADRRKCSWAALRQQGSIHADLCMQSSPSIGIQQACVVSFWLH